MKTEQTQGWNPQVSYFTPPISNTLPDSSLYLIEIFHLITGEQLKGITEELRRIVDPKQKQAFKARKFPYVTFGGSFSRRNEQGLLQSSGLSVFDFDHLENVDQVRQQLLQDDYFETQLLFVSPSGNGLKWVVKNEDPELPQKEFFLAVANYLRSARGLEVDESGKDRSRACYLAFDDRCVIHEGLM